MHLKFSKKNSSFLSRTSIGGVWLMVLRQYLEKRELSENKTFILPSDCRLNHDNNNVCQSRIWRGGGH